MLRHVAAAVDIRTVSTQADQELARELLREYAETLSDKICVQEFAAELAAMGSMYGPPHGQFWLALGLDQAALGCVAIRRYAAGDSQIKTVELKRLYVRSPARGSGLGRALVLHAIAEARARCCQRLVLDTLPEMQRAQALYRALGFVEVPPPAAVTGPRLMYFELALARV